MLGVTSTKRLYLYWVNLSPHTAMGSSVYTGCLVLANNVASPGCLDLQVTNEDLRERPFCPLEL